MGLLTPLAITIGAQPWMPRFLPQVTWVDHRLQRATRGRIGVLDIAGLPNLMLTVPGRRSGIPRSTPLLCVPDGADWLIAGSYFGAPKPPLWAANLRACETATVRSGGREHTVTWRELEGADRERAWAVMRTTWPNFDKYAERTDRVIPVFRLTPVD
ncbi:nitroreductase family deazaflavin-dependent oxidoreductase [Nocardioides panacisoli]|uniref:nitroreductase/quinone reductase family protein n=1 Tax=Nocardioides panacisoli TaxID=627624 RepID=UPI001C6351E5|nr:nitroreductase/quinone reductase family protein [Nocardioides panacisoli]QYJ03821.1 nitroreductase family deazaflavin-dependent oxidoreductase [Nocardioides panacisoli]